MINNNNNTPLKEDHMPDLKPKKKLNFIQNYLNQMIKLLIIRMVKFQ